MAILSTPETSFDKSKEWQSPCVDCLLHLEHHELRESCLAYMLDFFDKEYDRPSAFTRVQRYYAEYESRLLGQLVKGSDVCGDSKPSS